MSLLVIIVALLIIGGVYYYYHSKLTAAQSELQSIKSAETDSKRKLQTLQAELQSSTLDTVTNLPIWILFEDRLNQTLKESARYQLNVALLYVDIDDFKLINNALGYEAGNATLREVAKQLKSCIRGVDSISRFSKDVFVILLSQLSKPETAAIVAQRMLQLFADPLEIEGSKLNVTICIGIAIYPADGEDSETLLNHAEHAMRLARKTGKNVFQYYRQQLSVDSKRDLSLYTHFNSEQVFNQLVIYYQPVMNIQTNKILCMDSLLHWQPIGMELVKPNELEQLAEKRNKSNKLSEWLFQKACQQFVKWRNQGFEPEYLSVCLFIDQLNDTHFIYRLSQIMQENQFKPEWMMLRIKETGKLISFDVTEKAFNMLTYMGVQLAIENVGANTFSFRYLKNFTIKFLRLDSSITNDVEANEKTQTLVKSILSFADTLAVQIIIQEVESEGQANTLKEIGCTLLQGNYFGSLMTELDVAALTSI